MPTGGWRCGWRPTSNVDFSLNQPLSPFVLEALTHLDEDEPTHALDVLSMVEASLDDPKPDPRRTALEAEDPR